VIASHSVGIEAVAISAAPATPMAGENSRSGRDPGGQRPGRDEPDEQPDPTNATRIP
jgi:hypothetical protein